MDNQIKDSDLKYCRKCKDILKGHEDDGETLCRWCVSGWETEKSNRNMVYVKGKLVYG